MAAEREPTILLVNNPLFEQVRLQGVDSEPGQQIFNWLQTVLLPMRQKWGIYFDTAVAAFKITNNLATLPDTEPEDDRPFMDVYEPWLPDIVARRNNHLLTFRVKGAGLIPVNVFSQAPYFAQLGAEYPFVKIQTLEKYLKDRKLLNISEPLPSHSYSKGLARVAQGDTEAAKQLFYFVADQAAPFVLPPNQSHRTLSAHLLAARVVKEIPDFMSQGQGIGRLGGRFWEMVFQKALIGEENELSGSSLDYGAILRARVAKTFPLPKHRVLVFAALIGSNISGLADAFGYDRQKRNVLCGIRSRILTEWLAPENIFRLSENPDKGLIGAGLDGKLRATYFLYRWHSTPTAANDFNQNIKQAVDEQLIRTGLVPISSDYTDPSERVIVWKMARRMGGLVTDKGISYYTPECRDAIREKRDQVPASKPELVPMTTYVNHPHFKALRRAVSEGRVSAQKDYSASSRGRKQWYIYEEAAEKFLKAFE